jgi:hypothetical protein
METSEQPVDFGVALLPQHGFPVGVHGDSARTLPAGLFEHLHLSGESVHAWQPTGPNHALQRTAPRVTVAAHSATAFPPAAQLPRRAPQSLSLGLGAQKSLF